MRSLFALFAASWLTPACASSIPDTHYYDLAAAAPRRAAASDVTIAIEPLDVDAAYDDERIAYRESRVRLDYYHYHRWSAPPGVLVANALERAREASGRFRAVVRDQSAGAHLVLGGRLVALEEVDVSKHRWVGRIALELHLRDADTNEVLWSADLEEREPLRAQSPEGLARALSRATARVAARIAPALVTRRAGK